MEQHCICCQGNMTLKQEAERAVVALKGDVAELRDEIKRLETIHDDLNKELSDEQERADEEEELRDNACDLKDRAVADLRDEKARELSMLRRLEFSFRGGQCPLCFQAPGEHSTGCDMKLAIWRLDHEMVRTEYAD